MIPQAVGAFKASFVFMITDSSAVPQCGAAGAPARDADGPRLELATRADVIVCVIEILAL